MFRSSIRTFSDNLPSSLLRTSPRINYSNFKSVRGCSTNIESKSDCCKCKNDNISGEHFYKTIFWTGCTFGVFYLISDI